MASALALAAVGAGLLGVAGQEITPFQCDRQTPQRWMDRGPLLWAARNGASLGFGGLSRLGFVLWYVVPVASFLSGSPLLGGGIWGTYGFARAAGAGLLIALGYRLNDLDRVLAVALEKNRLAHRIAAGQLVVVGLVTGVIVGL